MPPHPSFKPIAGHSATSLQGTHLTPDHRHWPPLGGTTAGSRLLTNRVGLHPPGRLGPQIKIASRLIEHFNSITITEWHWVVYFFDLIVHKVCTVIDGGGFFFPVKKALIVSLDYFSINCPTPLWIQNVLRLKALIFYDMNTCLSLRLLCLHILSYTVYLSL